MNLFVEVLFALIGLVVFICVVMLIAILGATVAVIGIAVFELISRGGKKYG
jgi:hypothetical protein